MSEQLISPELPIAVEAINRVDVGVKELVRLSGISEQAVKDNLSDEFTAIQNPDAELPEGYRDLGLAVIAGASPEDGLALDALEAMKQRGKVSEQTGSVIQDAVQKRAYLRSQGYDAPTLAYHDGMLAGGVINGAYNFPVGSADRLAAMSFAAGMLAPQVRDGDMTALQIVNHLESHLGAKH